MPRIASSRNGQGRSDAGVEPIWRERIERWGRSGQSVAEFCRRDQVSQPSFYAWRRRIEARRRKRRSPKAREVRHGATGAAAFVPVRVVDRLSRAYPFEIAVPGGRTVRVAGEFEVESLRKLLSVLEGVSC